MAPDRPASDPAPDPAPEVIQSHRVVPTTRAPTIALSMPGASGLVDRLTEVLGPDELVVSADDERAADAEILLCLGRDREVLEQMLAPNVRWIHSFSTGVDGFPFDLVGDRILTCSRGASSVPIAEFVLASMLAFAKRFPTTWIHEPAPRWNAGELDSLAGRSVGIVGMGAIGTEVAKRALAFDMEVLGYRRTGVPAPLEGIELCASLDDLFARSDHLVLAAPATPETRHLVNERTLALVRPGVHLVNVARGSLVDQDALLGALDDGHVAFASLDTVEPEPLPEGHPFYVHERVHLSAHVSWAGSAGVNRTLEIFGTNVVAYRAGEPLHGVVDLAAGY